MILKSFRLGVAMLAAAAVPVLATAQVPVAWDGRGGANTNWITPANWEGDEIPSGSFDQTAVLSTGATTVINTDLASLTGLDSPPAGVTISDGSRLQITGAGAYRTQLAVGGVANGDAVATTGGVLELVGSQSFFEAPTLSFAGGGVYSPNITGASHGLISISGALNLGGGTLLPSFGFAASPQSWVLAEADVINGQLAIDTSLLSLGSGEVVTTSVEPGGTYGQQLVLSYNTVLTLSVDVDTHSLSLSSQSGAPITITGYSIASSNADLDPSGWSSLASQAAPGWDEVGTPSASRLEELAGPTGPSSQGGLQVTSTPRGLGAAYGADLPFLTAPTESLSFEYVTSTGELVDGVVEYTGLNAVNNLLLTVDPATGESELKNSSTTTIAIRGYTISSPGGGLKPSNGDWNSLQDQAVSGVDEANGSSNFLSELVPDVDNPLVLSPGESYSMGDLFDTTKAQDLGLEFILVGGGAVAGDFNEDGIVDAADYTVWRDGLGATYAASDYQVWRGHYGETGGGAGSTFPTGVVRYASLPSLSPSAAPAPEPGAVMLACAAILAAAAARRT
ncbi:MAG: hypothetical protein KDA37_10630 [Planctomycetales bacterium]|nr:hypothetical protein [Planctomycetales bacterium]